MEDVKVAAQGKNPCAIPNEYYIFAEHVWDISSFYDIKMLNLKKVYSFIQDVYKSILSIIMFWHNFRMKLYSTSF